MSNWTIMNVRDLEVLAPNAFSLQIPSCFRSSSIKHTYRRTHPPPHLSEAVPSSSLALSDPLDM